MFLPLLPPVDETFVRRGSSDDAMQRPGLYGEAWHDVKCDLSDGRVRAERNGPSVGVGGSKPRGGKGSLSLDGRNRFSGWRRPRSLIRTTTIPFSGFFSRGR